MANAKQIAMAQHHPLGQASRAAGVNQGGNVVGLNSFKGLLAQIGLSSQQTTPTLAHIVER